MPILIKSCLIGLKLTISIAVKELRHDGWNTMVLVCIIFSVVAPLLILFGLKQGVITSQREALLSDPCNLEIEMRGDYDLTLEWFNKMQKNPRVQFIVPIIYFLRMDIDVFDRAGKIHTIDLVPTGKGDPLLTMADIEQPLNNNQVLITHSLAKRFNLKQGDELKTKVFRNKQEQIIYPSFIIKNILPSYSCLQKSAIFITEDLLDSIDSFKDGKNVSLFPVENQEKYIETDFFVSTDHSNTSSDGFGVCENLGLEDLIDSFIIEHPNKLINSGLISNNVFSIKNESINYYRQRKNYAKARIFAKSLDDVPFLSDELHASKEEIEVRSKAAEIAKLKNLSHFLNYIFRVIFFIVIGSGVLALAGSFLMTIKNKRLQIAQLRLLGMGRMKISNFLWIQGVIVTSIAFFMAFLLSVLIKIISESIGKDYLVHLIQVTNKEEVTLFYLAWNDYLLAYAITFIFSHLVIAMGAKQASTIQAGEQLREI